MRVARCSLLSMTESTLDVAIVGAGAGGTYLADRLAGARPDWSITDADRIHALGLGPARDCLDVLAGGVNSDEVMQQALQPDPAIPIHVCGETFSRAQAWAEGALATAHALADQLLGERDG